MPILNCSSVGRRVVAAASARGCLLLFVLGSSLSACVDLFTRETPIYGPYYVARDPSATHYSLFYRGSGADYDRFQDVSRVCYHAGHVFIQSGRRYYWFAIRNDRDTDPGDPTIAHLISRPLTAAQFQHITDSLGTGPITYQFQN